VAQVGDAVHTPFFLGLRRREACFLRAMTNVTKLHECYERIERAYMEM